MLNDKISYFSNGKYQLQVINNDVYVNNSILTFLGSGADGIVYKHKNKAIKLYHDNYGIETHLSSTEIKRLCQIKTNHIILPKELLTTNNETLGFTMDYIDLNTKKNFLFIPIKQLIQEIKEIEKELSILGQNNFLLEDIEPRNLFFNGTLYLFDADSFTYEKNIDYSKKNIEMFTWCFIKAIALSLNNVLNNKEQTILVRKMHYLYTKGNYLLLSTFLEELSSNQNINSNLKIRNLIK